MPKRAVHAAVPSASTGAPFHRGGRARLPSVEVRRTFVSIGSRVGVLLAVYADTSGWSREQVKKGLPSSDITWNFEF